MFVVNIVFSCGLMWGSQAGLLFLILFHEELGVVLFFKSNIVIGILIDRLFGLCLITDQGCDEHENSSITGEKITNFNRMIENRVAL